MKGIIHSKVGGTVLVVAGLVIWLLGSNLIPEDNDWMDNDRYWTISFTLGALSFLIVGCFLPELRIATFLSRKSSLGLMAFFLALATHQLFLPLIRRSDDSIWVEALVLVATIVIFGSSYYLATFLIRGLRARAEYLANSEQDKPDRHVTNIHS